jgi:ferric hydroxamate transport system permease protein
MRECPISLPYQPFTASSVRKGVISTSLAALSFVGLIAPHMARMLGFQRSLSQLFAAALLGGPSMLSADWLGHNVLFPYEVSAGLLAAFIGAPYFLWLMQIRDAPV